MAKRKKKRTSIRTAAGTAQEIYLGKLRALADDPLCVLPVCPQGEPKTIATLHAQLDKIAAGKAGFLLKRDRGVAGAVLQSLPLAEMEAAPRLLDHKVGGRRRFYLMRGQVERACMLGVQNHDDPLVLLMAYRSLAKTGLYFFAADRVYCSGERPVPPDAWWELIGQLAEIEWQDHRCKTCPHPEGDLVEIMFPDGPGVAVCGKCSRKIGSLHATMKARFAGPQERRPFQVHVLRGGVDGTREEVPREALAEYRAGVRGEASLL